MWLQLMIQEGDTLATDQAKKGAWGSGQNEAAAVSTPEVAAATRLWVSASYCHTFLGA